MSLVDLGLCETFGGNEIVGQSGLSLPALAVPRGAPLKLAASNHDRHR